MKGVIGLVIRRVWLFSVLVNLKLVVWRRRMGGRGRTRRQGRGEDEQTRQANGIEAKGRENGKYPNVGNGNTKRSIGVNVSQEV